VSFTDSHAHLDDPRFDADRAAVLARARAAGVERILVVASGSSAAEYEKTLRRVEQHDGLWAALGLHPHEAQHASKELLAELTRLAQQPRVLAWGRLDSITITTTPRARSSKPSSGSSCRRRVG